MTGRKNLHWTDRPANVLSASPARPSYSRGMHPKPQDARSLYRNLTRIAWALHCLQERRARNVIVLDRQDRQVIELRREFDECANALETVDPDLYDRAMERKRDLDNPKKALEWSIKGGPEEVL